jgi:cell division protein FtsW (lipid II flippase)
MTLPPLRRPRPADLTATFAGFPLPPDLELPNYRRRELGMLVFAGALATAALAALMEAHNGRLTFQVATYGFGFFVLWGLGHLAVRRFAPAADPLLLPLAAALNGLGLVMIYRIDLARADAQRKAHVPVTASAAQTQLVWVLIAIIVFVLVLAIVRDHTTLTRYTYTAGLAGLVFLLLPAVPGIGASINGARLWLRVGPFSFQPSEVSKILLMIFFAGYLGRMREVISIASPTLVRFRIPRRRGGEPRPVVVKLPRPRDLGPVLVAWAASLGVLVIENDLGSSLLLFAIFLVILYTATEQALWVAIGLLLFSAGAFAADHIFAHVQVRVDGWLHAFDGSNPSGKSYQLVQGLYGFAAGGLTGTGLGRGNPRKVPFSNTDFIMASLGEELGLTGVMAILALYGLIVMRGLRAAMAARDPFGKLLATGLAASFAFQVFVQVGGVMRLIPLTGITLPFMSYGGSSIVANAAIIALLLRISDDSARKPRDVTDPAPLYDPDAVAAAQTQVVVKST